MRETHAIVDEISPNGATREAGASHDSVEIMPGVKKKGKNSESGTSDIGGEGKVMTLDHSIQGRLGERRPKGGKSPQLRVAVGKVKGTRIYQAIEAS